MRRCAARTIGSLNHIRDSDFVSVSPKGLSLHGQQALRTVGSGIFQLSDSHHSCLKDLTLARCRSSSHTCGGLCDSSGCSSASRVALLRPALTKAGCCKWKMPSSGHGEGHISKPTIVWRRRGNAHVHVALPTPEPLAHHCPMEGLLPVQGLETSCREPQGDV